MTDDERIAVLRRRCRERKEKAWWEHLMPRAAALRASTDIASWQERQGVCVRALLAQARFDVDDLELLVGRLSPERPAHATDEAIAEAREFMAKFPPSAGQTGHCELHTQPVMEQGIDGVVADIRARLSQAEGESAAFYRSCLSALEGLTLMIRNALAAVNERIPSAAPARQAELRLMAETCAHVAHQPPRTFREAIQLMWFVIIGVSLGDNVGLIGPGHLDRTLRRFYELDIESGVLTRAEALILIESLYLMINERIPDGLAVPVMVGGRDVEGNDVTNDLSFLCLEALRRTNLVYPTVGICRHKGTPAALVDLAVELIADGYTTPAFFGDEVIQKGLRELGVPPADACNYINSTCVEITPVGASNVWVASPYFNTCAVLLEEIIAGADDPPVSFQAFKAGYYKRLHDRVAAGAAGQNEKRVIRRQNGRKPLQSVFTRDCLARGRDIDDGGAVYNWVECSFVGLANLADSFYVIDQEIYRTGKLDFRQLKKILDADYQGYEAIRQRFLNTWPKYGQDDPKVDAIVAETVDFAVKTCAELKMRPDDSPFVPGAFVWVMHERFGRQTGATPDGRKAGTPLADGAGPAQGRETKGPTAAILSVTSWDHSPLIGGVAFNMKFNTALLKERSVGAARLRDLITVFLERGGFETQINVVDRETLLKARDNPDDYRDLVVRIGGYTDYFTRLSPEMQSEVLQRTEYGDDI